MSKTDFTISFDLYSQFKDRISSNEMKQKLDEIPKSSKQNH